MHPKRESALLVAAGVVSPAQLVDKDTAIKVRPPHSLSEPWGIKHIEHVARTTGKGSCW